jgi:hypothetical protein
MPEVDDPGREGVGGCQGSGPKGQKLRAGHQLDARPILEGARRSLLKSLSPVSLDGHGTHNTRPTLPNADIGKAIREVPG